MGRLGRMGKVGRFGRKGQVYRETNVCNTNKKVHSLMEKKMGHL